MGTPLTAYLSRPLAFLLLLAALMAIASVATADTPPPSSGDWTVGDTTTVSGTDIQLDGCLTVTSGGHLHLSDLNLTMNMTVDHGAGIYVDEGGRLSLMNVSILSSDPDYHYWFEIRGIATIEDCDVRDVASNDERWSSWSTVKGGVQVYNSNTTVIDSSFHDSQRMNMYVEDADPIIQGCRFYNSEYVCTQYGQWQVNQAGSPYYRTWQRIFFSDATGLYLERADPQIRDCNFSANGLPSTALDITVHWSQNIIVTLGRGIMAHDSSPFIYNCTFHGNGLQPEDTTVDRQRIIFFDSVRWIDYAEGGLACLGADAHPSVWDSSFTDNDLFGVSAHNGAVPRLLANVTFTGNSNARFTPSNVAYIYTPSAAIFVEECDSPITIRGAHISGNYVRYNINAVCPSVIIVNCSSNQSLSEDGYNLYFLARSVTIADSTLWGQGHHSNLFFYHHQTGNHRITNTTFKGGEYGIYVRSWTNAISRMLMVDCSIDSTTTSSLYLDDIWVDCINCTAPPPETFTSSYRRAELRMHYYVTVEVAWQSAGPVPGALVEVLDAQDGNLYAGVTDDEGRLGPFIALSITYYYGGSIDMMVNSPIRVNVTKGDTRHQSLPNVFTTNIEVQVIVPDDRPPDVLILAPTEGQTRSSDIIPVVAWASDSETGINHVECSVNDGPWEPMVGDGVYHGNLTGLEGANHIQVRAVDRTGNEATAHVWGVGVDLTPPGILIAEPGPSPHLTNASMVTVSGSTEAGATVTVDGSEIENTGGDFTFDVELPVDGLHQHIVTAVDGVGNRASVIVSIIRDTTPPDVRVETPGDDVLTNGTSVTISGTGTGTEGVLVQGVWVDIQGGRFTREVDLVEGLNIITVEAWDALENSVVVEVRVTRDTMPPQVVMEHPTGDLLLNVSQVEVRGTVGTDVEAVFVNGLLVAIKGEAFRETVQLQQGRNTVRVNAIDRAGNTWHATYRVDVDVMPPILWVSSPVDGAVVTERTVMVTGVVEDFETLIIDGREVPTTGDFSDLVVLRETPPGGKANAIQVVAVDDMGNQVSVVVHVVCDTTPPGLTVGQVVGTTEAAQVHIAGRVDDLEDLSHLTVNGWHVPVDDDSTFNVTVALALGYNTIEVVAFDHAGNADTRSVMVERTEVPAPPEEPEGFPGWGLFALVVAILAGAALAVVINHTRGQRGGD